MNTNKGYNNWIISNKIIKMVAITMAIIETLIHKECFLKLPEAKNKTIPQHTRENKWSALKFCIHVGK